MNFDIGDTGNSGVDVGDIGHSLRFRPVSSTYLSKTFSASNRKTWTWSGWAKVGASLLVPFFSAKATKDDLLFFGLNGVGQFGFTNRPGGVDNGALTSNALYRDGSAHYHFVISVDTTLANASDRVVVYVSGVRVTSWAGSAWPSQNSDMYINSTQPHFIGGRQDNAFDVADGYLSRVCFVDGQALTPASFGYLNPETNQWVSKPQSQVKAVVDAGGANSFMLDFDDGTSLTTLGYDKSSKANHWTMSGFSLTAGEAYDWMLDTPSNNFATLNPLNPPNGVTVSGANLDFACADDAAAREVFGTIAIKTGKVYFEALKRNTCERFYIGIVEAIYKPGQAISYGKLSFDTSTASNTLVMFAVDFATGMYWTGTGGVFSGSPAAGTGGISFTVGNNYWVAVAGGYRETQPSAVGSMNFGQRPFAYTPPTGFKSLCTANLPDSAIPNPKRNFDVVLATGPNIKLNSEAVFPGNFFEWIKDRANVNNHQLIDTVRGSSAVLQSNTTAAETTYVTPSGSSVGWVWKAGGAAVANTDGAIASQVSANRDAGFSVVTYTGTGANGTVGHGLAKTPDLIIGKGRSTSFSWLAWAKGLTGLEYLILNSTAAKASAAAVFNSALPTSSVFNLGSDVSLNSSGATQIAYCFHDVEGYQKIGSYIGNGSADGPFVHCGFRPRYLLIKKADSAGDWVIIDSAREQYNSGNRAALFPHLSSAETVDAYPTDIVSNGFKLRNAGAINISGGTYIFYAVAEQTFKYANAR